MLILGAGGGLALRARAEAQPGWRFTGVDPQAAEQAGAAVSNTMELPTAEDDEACLREAGVQDVALRLAAFSWRGRSARGWRCDEIPHGDRRSST